MTNYQRFIMACALISAAAFAFQGGCYFERHHRMPLEIAGGCAYYDMDTGNFTWGIRPVTIGRLPSNDDPDLPGIKQAPLPKKKPHVKTVTFGGGGGPGVPVSQ